MNIHIFFPLLCILIPLRLFAQDSLSVSSVPPSILGSWYFTDGSDLMAYELNTESLIYGNQHWKIHFVRNRKDIYQIIVKNKEETQEFFIRLPKKNYIQISDHNRKFYWFKKYPYLPNTPHKELRELSSALKGSWYTTDGKQQKLIGFDQSQVYWKGNVYPLIHAYQQGEYFTLTLGRLEHPIVLEIKNWNHKLLEIVDEHSISTFVKRDLQSYNGVPISPTQLPDSLFGKWYTAGPNSALTYDIRTSSINQIDIFMTLKKGTEYCFQLVNGQSIYCKMDTRHYLWIAENDKKFQIYHSGPFYSEVTRLAPSSIPTNLRGKWYDTMTDEWTCTIGTSWILQHNTFWSYQMVGIKDFNWMFILESPPALRKMEIQVINNKHIRIRESEGEWRQLKRS